MKSFLVILLLITIFSCRSSSDASDLNNTSPDSTIGKRETGYEIKQLAGVFAGKLPCADCPGIDTKVYLKPDLTFVMERHYIDKNTLYETGTWAVSDSLLRLTGTDAPQNLKIASYAELEILGSDGKAIQSPQKMSLLRNNIPFKPLQPVPVSGIFTARGDTMRVHICSMNKDYPATLAPTAMIMTAKYKAAAKQPGTPLYADLAGHFELRPSLNDTTTQDFFVVEKFIKFQPGQECK